MTFESEISELPPLQRREYGFARVRDVAFDSLRALWVRRRNEGMKQIDIANVIGRDPAWISRTLRGPGNLTFRSFGEMVEALNGEVEITINAMEDPLPVKPNYDAYLGYGDFSRTPAQPPIPQPSAKNDDPKITDKISNALIKKDQLSLPLFATS